MEFVVFERADSALLIVPAMFRAPVSCGDTHELRTVGRCDIELGTFSPRVVTELGLHGFASVDGADLEHLRPHLRPGAAIPG